MSCGWCVRVVALMLAAGLAPVHAAGEGEARGGAPAQAQALWKRHCGPCHLEGGTGTFMLARRLGAERALLEKRTDLTAQYVQTVVRHGIQSMPRFSRAELPDEELAQIARYLGAR